MPALRPPFTLSFNSNPVLYQCPRCAVKNIPYQQAGVSDVSDQRDWIIVSCKPPDPCAWLHCHGPRIHTHECCALGVFTWALVHTGGKISTATVRAAGQASTGCSLHPSVLDRRCVPLRRRRCHRTTTPADTRRTACPPGAWVLSWRLRRVFTGSLLPPGLGWVWGSSLAALRGMLQAVWFHPLLLCEGCCKESGSLLCCARELVAKVQICV